MRSMAPPSLQSSIRLFARDSWHSPRPLEQIAHCNSFPGPMTQRCCSCFPHTFESRNIVLLCCDLQILCDCLLELAQGLFDGGGLVDTVDGGGLKLLGFTKGLQSCCEASAVQVGLAQTLPTHPVARVRPQRCLQTTTNKQR